MVEEEDGLWGLLGNFPVKGEQRFQKACVELLS